MKKVMKVTALVMLLLMVIGVFAGCNQKGTEQEGAAEQPQMAEQPQKNLIDIAQEMVPLASLPPAIFDTMPVPSGVAVSANEKAAVDYSNARDGYIMVKYLGNSDKALKVLIVGPSANTYTYSLNLNGEYDVYPLSDGNGGYTVTVYENVEGTKYATVNTAKFDVTLTNEFAPFIRPNQFVNYNTNSKTVATAAELIGDIDDPLEKIALVFDYVTENLTYDEELAANVKSGYLPDVDAVLAGGRGICFDYAAVMTAMLRSQDVPTKLVVGYTGEVYHAWINIYSDETGWIGSVVYFDGESWKLMDPTFYSTAGGSENVKKYIGDGSNYTAKYLY